MSADRLTLSELVAQRSGFLNEHGIWCLLSEGAHSLSTILTTDPGSWVRGPSLLISPDTFLIGPDRVEFCQGVYSSETEEQSLFMPPELAAYKGEELERGEVEKMYMFSLGMCMVAAAMSLQEDSEQELELKLTDKNLSDLLTRMGEEDASRRDVTLQTVLDACAAYKEACGEDLRLGALTGAVQGQEGSEESSMGVDVEIGEFEVLDNNTNNHIPLSRELDNADSPPPVPPSPPPRHPSTTLQRVNSLDNLYRHISTSGTDAQVQKSFRFSGMYSRHISASCDDVTTFSGISIPSVPLDTDTSLLIGLPQPVLSLNRPLSTDSTGIPRTVTPAKEYSGDSSGSSSSSVAGDQLESGSSTLSEGESGEEELISHTPNTLIKLTREELVKVDTLPIHESDQTDPELSPSLAQQESPPPTPTNQHPPSPSEESPVSSATQDDVIISIVETRQQSLSHEIEFTTQDSSLLFVPSPVNRDSPPPILPREPTETGDSPILRQEDQRGRQRRSETDLLTLSQALEAGTSLPVDSHSGTESGDELTPSLVRKKQGSGRRRMSDQEVFVFDPTYDDEWQHLESREESMKKLKKVLGPDFQRLTGNMTSDPMDELPIPLSPSRTPADRREVEVILLNTRKFVATVEETSLVGDLFLQVVTFLSLQEPNNFSLAVIEKREEVFLDLDIPLLKYAPRGWLDRQTDMSIHSRGKRRGRSRRFSLYFRVKFFVENVRLLKSRQTRHLYYLQLRKDLLEGRVACDEEPALSLAGLSLQIEIGDYRPEFETSSYYKQEDFLPQRVTELVPADTIVDTLRQLHQSHQGLSRTEAELAYLKQAQKLPEYGIVYHRLYYHYVPARMCWQKRGQQEEVWAGVSTRGFVLSEVRDVVRVPVISFSWKLIKLMWYRNKRFVIEPQEPLPHSEIFFLTNSFKQSKYLLRLSQQFHTFQMQTRSRGSEELSPNHLGDGVSFYSSKGSLSTLHSGKSDPYVPLTDADTELLPLPSGLDIPAEPGLKLMSVSLKHATGLGFGLTVILNPPDRIPGLYIQHIAENGPAHLDGRLKLYDQIMSVNGKPITGSTYKYVLNLLQTSREIELIVKTECEVVDSVFTMETPVISSKLFPGRLERGYEEFEVTLKRGLSEDFGFTVEDVQGENGEVSVVIREITSRDVAGMLLPGDRILEVNSVRLVTLKSAEIKVLMEAFTDIHILIQRDTPTEEKRISQIGDSGYARMSPADSPKKMTLPPIPLTLPVVSDMLVKNTPYSEVRLSKTRKPSPKTDPHSPPPVPPTTQEKFMEPSYLEFETELVKQHGSLGLNINILTREPDTPVYVTELVGNSPAQRSGKILPGDQIVSANGQILTDMGVAEQVKILGDLPDGQTVLFKLRREHNQVETPVRKLGVVQTEEVFEKLEKKPFETAYPPSNLEATTVSVMLSKSASGGLGIRLHTVIETDGTFCVYIKEILKGSPASQAAELHPGARIVSINHQSLVGVDRHRAVSMLKKAASPVIIVIIPDPLMVASELSLTTSPPPPAAALEGDIPLKRVNTDTTLSHESLPGHSASTMEIMAVLDSPNVREEQFSVTLVRGEKGLGLKVISKVSDQTGLVIKSVLDAPALSTGMFEIGDEIVAIDGVNIQNMKREDVLVRIKGESGTSVILDMKRYIRIESSVDVQESDREREERTRPEDDPANLLLNQVSTNSYSRPLPTHGLIEHVFELKLSRGSDEKLGIHLGQLPPDHFPTGIHVKKLTDSSVASADGRLSVDDILLEANGIDLRNLNKDEAVDTLKQFTGDINFLVARYAPYDFPAEVADEAEVEVPPLPESAPPPLLLPSQNIDLSLVLDQTPTDTINTDTIVLDSASHPDQSLPSMESSESVPTFSSSLLPPLPSMPPPDIIPNPFLQHKGIQESRVRLVEPYTQLRLEVYALEDLRTEIQLVNGEMEPQSVENDFKEVRLRKADLPVTVAKLPYNVKKNRSLRVVPYDSNRVALNTPDPQDDYINASLVQLKVNELEFKYVCTQAPLSSEVGRFWQMVWEQELYVIVMLVMQKEYGSRRTPPYWDQSENSQFKDEEKMDFANFSVMLVEENEEDKLVTRSVYLTNKSNGERRHIYHFTYKLWSGTGIPKSVGDFSLFVEFIRERVMATEILVHCHIGVGRTGSFCLVDILSRLVKNRVRADLFQLVVALNANRMNLIQTLEQYKFGYSALVHLLFERNP